MALSILSSPVIGANITRPLVSYSCSSYNYVSLVLSLLQQVLYLYIFLLTSPCSFKYLPELTFVGNLVALQKNLTTHNATGMEHAVSLTGQLNSYCEIRIFSKPGNLGFTLMAVVCNVFCYGCTLEYRKSSSPCTEYLTTRCASTGGAVVCTVFWLRCTMCWGMLILQLH